MADTPKKRRIDGAASWDEVERHLKQLRKEHDDAQTSAKTESVEVANLTQFLQQSQKRYKHHCLEAKSCIASLQAENEELSKDITRAGTELKGTQAMLDKCQERCTALDAELDSARERCTRYKHQVEELSQQGGEARGTERRLQTELDAANAQCRAAIAERDKALNVLSASQALQLAVNTDLAELATPAMALGEAIVDLREALGLFQS